MEFESRSSDSLFPTASLAGLLLALLTLRRCGAPG
jgi:hypothetical protein